MVQVLWALNCQQTTRDFSTYRTVIPLSPSEKSDSPDQTLDQGASSQQDSMSYLFSTI
jgi:hypothetical protein